MKCAFLLQRQFAYVGHYLAETLKRDHGFENFCGYVYLRSSFEFLKQQKDISYTSLILDQDIHERYKTEKLDLDFLRDLEKKIGLPSLWPYLIADRVMLQDQMIREYPHEQLKYTHEELLRMLQVRAKAMIEFFERERPDVVFGIPPGALGSMLFFHLGKHYGAKTFFVVPTNVPNRYLLSEDYTTFTPVDARFRTDREKLKQSPSWAWAENFLREFRNKPKPNFEKTTPTHQPVTRTQQFKFVNPKIFGSRISTIAKSLVRHFRTSERNDYDYVNPFLQLLDLLKRKLRNIRGNDDLYDSFDPNDDFVFFPLHYEPELSLLVLAPYYTDQITLIRQIARSLPVGMKLAVKEHPAMAQYRARSFYKELKKIPNLKLIPPTFTSFDVTTHAKLVVTITGTVGWEATLFGIPVISFGHQNFNALKNVTYCHEIESLPKIIADRIANPSYDEEDTIAYLAALYEESFEMNLKHVWEEETDQERRKRDITPLADACARAFRA